MWNAEPDPSFRALVRPRTSRRQREQEARHVHRLNLLAAVALLPVAVVVVALYAAGAPTTELVAEGDRDAAREACLDPNTAPWWELTYLPAIGESRAKAIVAHREQVRMSGNKPQAVVFRRAEDLEAVRGIGPKTVARIAPYLAFRPE